MNGKNFRAVITEISVWWQKNIEFLNFLDNKNDFLAKFLSDKKIDRLRQKMKL